jgi:hypothetical protein
MSDSNGITLPEAILHGCGGATLSVKLAVPNVSQLSFTANTITAVSGQWAWYTGTNYTGSSGVVVPDSVFSSEADCAAEPPGPSRFQGLFCLPFTIFTTTTTTIKSVKPYIGQIILYENTDYSGSSLPLYASANTLVGSPHHFNDKAHSVRVVSGKWKLWSNVNFSGAHMIYSGPGATSPLPASLNGKVSSVELLR